MERRDWTALVGTGDETNLSNRVVEIVSPRLAASEPANPPAERI
jgi:hypothetical protein